MESHDGVNPGGIVASRRCGCASDSCACVISPSGENVLVTGTGTATNPYVIDVSPEIGSLTVVDENLLVRTGTLMLHFQGGGITATQGSADDEVVVTVPSPPTGRVLSVVPITEVFTMSGTWTKPDDLMYVVIETVGGGGGSGGVGATVASQSAASGAGGGGGYAKKTMLASSLPGTVAVTVGAGGTAGTNAPGGGGTGGTSSFDGFCSAFGGVGGASSTSTASTTFATGGVGGVGGLGDVFITGGRGGWGTVLTASRLMSAIGGASHMGAGGLVNNSAVGDPGSLYGGGGGGTTSGPSLAARTGAAGADGVVIVTSYTKTT